MMLEEAPSNTEGRSEAAEAAAATARDSKRQEKQTADQGEPISYLEQSAKPWGRHPAFEILLATGLALLKEVVFPTLFLLLTVICGLAWFFGYPSIRAHFPDQWFVPVLVLGGYSAAAMLESLVRFSGWRKGWLSGWEAHQREGASYCSVPGCSVRTWDACMFPSARPTPYESSDSCEYGWSVFPERRLTLRDEPQDHKAKAGDCMFGVKYCGKALCERHLHRGSTGWPVCDEHAGREPEHPSVMWLLGRSHQIGSAKSGSALPQSGRGSGMKIIGNVLIVTGVMLLTGVILALRIEPRRDLLPNEGLLELTGMVASGLLAAGILIRRSPPQ